MKTQQVSISLYKTTVIKLDNKRGLVPRSRAIQFIISNYLLDKRNGPLTKGSLISTMKKTKEEINTIE